MRNKLIRILTFILMALPVLAQITVNGVVTDPQENPVQAASIIIEPLNPPNPLLAQKATSNKDGRFNMMFESPLGKYLLKVSSSDFQKIKKIIYLENGVNNLTIKLTPIVHTSINVTASNILNNEIKLEKTELSQTLTEHEIIDIPSTRSDKILEIVGKMPGAIIGPAGRLHIAGDPANLHNNLLGPFSISDPISFLLEANISPEAIDSIDMFSGRFSVARGKGFATLIFNPKIDIKDWKSERKVKKFKRLKFNATNFFPGVNFSKGLNIDNWRPRITVSGTIKKDRIWFSNGLLLAYKKRIFYELPKDQDKTRVWNINNLFSFQTNLNDRNILNFNFLIDRLIAPRAALSPLNPPETTTDDKKNIRFFSIKNTAIINPRAILETGFGRYESYFGKIPHCIGIFKITPFGNKGCAPATKKLWGKRNQFLVNFAFTPSGLENHRLKAGIDINQSFFKKDFRRTGFMHHRIDNSPTSLTMFSGSGRVDGSNLEFGSYFQNSINIIPKNWLPNMYLQLGFRLDKDKIIARNEITSRYSLTIMPKQLKDTKFSIGFGFIPSPYPLSLYTRHLDQYSTNTSFDRSGNVVSKINVVFTANPKFLTLTKTTNFSIGMEKRIANSFFIQINALRKRSRDGHTFLLTDKPVFPLVQKLPETENPILFYELRNIQKIIYDSIEIAAKKTGKIRNRFYNWIFSYIRSRGRSNASLNAFIDDPIIYSDIAGLMPWDTPHRLISYGYFELNKKNAISYHCEWRTGFPFTSYDDEGRQVGAFNSRRFPDYFSLNIHYERRFKLFGRKWAIRIGSDNITNTPNYTFVNANTANPRYPDFSGIQPRKPIVVRIRILN